MYKDRISRDEVLNPYKAHLATLPDLEQPVGTVNGDGNILVIFPIFQVGDNDQSIEHHVTRSACWARRTWARYTDANTQGVGMKFYIEDSVKDRVIPILKQNYVQDDDLLFFDGGSFEVHSCMALGKKHAFYGDTQFASYEWVLQMDSDMFVGRPTGESSVGKPKSAPFFESFHDLPYKNLGGLSVYTPQAQGFDITDWIVRILPLGTTRKEMAQEWLRRAKMLIDPRLVLPYERGDGVPIVHGGIYAFPANKWHIMYPDKVEWIVNAGKMLQHDEAALSLWMAQGNDVFDIAQLTGLRMIPTPRDIIGCENDGDIYLLHGGSLPEEHFFREHMTN